MPSSEDGGARGSARRLARNALAPMAARLLDLGFALVYLRLLGRAGVGDYQLLVVLTTYLDTLVDFGLNTIVARDLQRAAAAAGAVFRTVALVRLGLWLLGLPLIAVVYGPARERAGLLPEAAIAGWVFYLALLPSVLAKTATGLLWGYERLELSALVSTLATVLRTALGLLLLFGGFGLVGLASSSLVVNLVTASALLLLLGRVRAARPGGADAGQRRLPATRAPALLRESWPLFVNQLLQGLFFKIDSVLLPGLAGDAAAGAYAAAYKVSENAGIISSSFTLALFPRLAAYAGATPAGLVSAYRLALRFLLELAFPLAAGAALLAEPIVTLLAGRGFLPDAATALAILIWYLPFSFANGLTQYVLIAVGRQRFLTRAFLAAFVFNLGANLALIPRLGFVGAAWVTVASELVLLVPFHWAARRAVPGVSLLREAWHPILATALMAPVVWWLRDAVHPLAAIGGGALVYPAALWALGGIDREQWAAARRVLAPE